MELSIENCFENKYNKLQLLISKSETLQELKNKLICNFNLFHLNDNRIGIYLIRDKSELLLKQNNLSLEQYEIKSHDNLKIKDLGLQINVKLVSLLNLLFYVISLLSVFAYKTSGNSSSDSNSNSISNSTSIELNIDVFMMITLSNLIPLRNLLFCFIGKTENYCKVNQAILNLILSIVIGISSGLSLDGQLKYESLINQVIKHILSSMIFLLSIVGFLFIDDNFKKSVKEYLKSEYDFTKINDIINIIIAISFIPIFAFNSFVIITALFIILSILMSI